MFSYEISRVAHVLIPYIAPTLSVIIGVIISNTFWKARIHRYAKTEVVQTLEYQKNKIERLEEIIKEKDSIISSLKGSLKVSKMAALRIIEVIK